MSKMGQWNLELQEQANELGFVTTQEALDNDYSIVDGQLTYDAEKGLKSAHEAWLKEKEEVLAAIDRIKTSMENIYGEDFKPEVAAIALDGNPDKAFRYSEILKIKKFIEEAHD